MKYLKLVLFNLMSLSSSMLLESRHPNDCIPDNTAKQLLANFVALFEPQKFTVELAKKVLTPDYSQYSASTNFLLGKMGGPTCANRDECIKLGQASAGSPPVEILVLDADHTCNKLYFRWKTNDTEIRSIYGFDELLLAYTKDGWKVKKDYSEFNNAIILYNAGLFPCNANNTPTPGT